MQHTEGYHCRTCGQYHAELPMALGPDAPLPWYSIPEAERATRGELTSDACVIDDKQFFIRGCLDLPVHDGPRPFSWLVWCSLSEPNFARAAQLWETPGRENEPPYFGWLCSRLPGYPDTHSLKTMVHTRPVGQRPFVELEPTGHSLAVEQREGITMARLQEIVEQCLHPQTNEGK
jgi:hypothetical protein